MMEDQHVILFDGVCNLCNGAVQFVLKHERNQKLRFTALQSQTGEELLQKHGFPAEKMDSFVLIQGGKAFTKSDAAVRAAHYLKLPYRLAAVGIIVPRPIRNKVYEYIARNRYKWFGKKDECMLPSPDIKERFI
ncbi:thiol-disulfide oxidoreductase DCC family protein [Fictibacillus aquaticus]|uniref:Thiol-disulfide oxidoreductase n=1 Tax=Fictibacillus aquaticus TaxID=2021314 RepID=A0A235F825_9BACL|nr:thiol-disulfide oxidoreductase DCC family protein [Fictibacillus aquaticus]OYD57501.1 hypothetical protein CGZ90_12555 [Fictibacillus aquaticus]